MNDRPRFEIFEQIGYGQFSQVFKARWVNAPPVASVDDSTQTADLAQVPDDHRRRGQIFRTPSESANHTLGSHSREPGGAQRGGDKYVALKRIKFYDIQNSKLRMDCVKEVKLLQQLKHPNIINYNISFIERNELFIVLELADGGDLSKLIRYFQRQNKLIGERSILKYFTQICSAVRYIHSKRILHRDIKPANIFMTSDGCVKLGDFGLGRFFSQNTCNAHSIVGTFYYMSPERIRESGYGFSSDVWSLGCVLYELITLNSPFSIYNLEDSRQKPNHYLNNQHKNNQSPQAPPLEPVENNQSPFNLQWLVDRIVRADYPSLDSYTDISYSLRQLTTQCLNPDAEARPNMEYICAVVGEAYRIQLNASSSNPAHVNNSNNNNSNTRCSIRPAAALPCRQ